MGKKVTQIRVTNIGKEEAEINFKELISGVDLNHRGIRYNYEGEGEENKDREAYHMRIVSTGVLKSIRKMIYPKVDLKDYKKRMDTLVDIPIDIKAEKVKLILGGMNHIVVSFYHN